MKAKKARRIAERAALKRPEAIFWLEAVKAKIKKTAESGETVLRNALNLTDNELKRYALKPIDSDEQHFIWRMLRADGYEIRPSNSGIDVYW